MFTFQKKFIYLEQKHFAEKSLLQTISVSYLNTVIYFHWKGALIKYVVVLFPFDL